MAARPVYEADRAVLEECARRGVSGITVRKLERWRHLLPRRIVEHRSGLHGSRSGNPPDYVDQVIAVEALLTSGVSLRDVPMRLFEQGFEVDLKVLRTAYADLYARVREGLVKALPDTARADVEPADRADALASIHARGIRRTATGRQWATRINRLVRQAGALEGDDSDALFVSTISVMFTWLVAGEPPSAQGTVDALTAVGLNDGQDPDVTAVHLARINLDALCAAIETAAEAQWIAARQDVDLVVRHVELRRRVDQHWQASDPLLDGVSDVGLDDPGVRSSVIPVALVLGETWHQQFHAEHERYQAASQLLDDLPDTFRSFFRADGEARLEQQSAEFRTELGAFLVEWSHRHPTYAAVLTFVLPSTPAE